MRRQLEEYEVWLLDYCLTSNHVHLLLEAEDRLQISGLMRDVAGEFARAYNRRKARLNAFWGDNFHATLWTRTWSIFSLALKNGRGLSTNAQFGFERLLAPIQGASLRRAAITQGDARRRACPGLIYLGAFSAGFGHDGHEQFAATR